MFPKNFASSSGSQCHLLARVALLVHVERLSSRRRRLAARGFNSFVAGASVQVLLVSRVHAVQIQASRHLRLQVLQARGRAAAAAARHALLVEQPRRVRTRQFLLNSQSISKPLLIGMSDNPSLHLLSSFVLLLSARLLPSRPPSVLLGFESRLVHLRRAVRHHRGNAFLSQIKHAHLSNFILLCLKLYALFFSYSTVHVSTVTPNAYGIVAMW